MSSESSKPVTTNQKQPRPCSLSDFDYDLPRELIAQAPLAERDQARLLVLRRQKGEIAHRGIRDLPELLSPGDLLVLNDTRVLAARLLGTRERTGGKWEGLFLEERQGVWELMCRTRGRPSPGEWIRIEGGALRLELLEQTGQGHWLARPDLADSTLVLLERHGHVPLPPYIRKGVDRPEDRHRYQTVYASRPGAVAAPTAGLHFTESLLAELEKRGIGRAACTLHVGAGTFQPIQADDLNAHRMHREWGELPDSTAAQVRQARARGGRVVAVGTTTVRVLETAAARGGELAAWSGETDLFIRPPYRFRAVDALLTNFHLPRSTLLVLVSALAGIEWTRNAYRAAVAERYRFYSYGDAMLVL